MKINKLHNVVWTGAIILYITRPYDYEKKFIDILPYALMYILITNLAIYVGSKIRLYSKKKHIDYNFKKIKFGFWLIVILSITSLTFGLYELFILNKSFDFNISLSGFTDLRYSLIRSDYEMGSNLSGIISTSLSGFCILSVVFYFYYYQFLNKSKKSILLSIVVFYFLMTFTTGGRNASFFLVIISFLSYLSFTNNFNSKINWYRITSIVLVIILIYSSIFIIRISTSNVSMDLNEYANHFSSISPYEIRAHYRYLLNSKVGFIFFPILQFHHYVSHSLNELIILVNYQVDGMPFWGGYQLSNFTLLFNKIGFDITTISTIYNSLPKPGVYFTLLGALYLDFGKYLMFPALFILYTMVGMFSKVENRITITQNSFYYLLILIILLSPVYGVLGMANSTPFLVSIIIYKFIIG